jgi:hypothetical protein
MEPVQVRDSDVLAEVWLCFDVHRHESLCGIFMCECLLFGSIICSLKYSGRSIPSGAIIRRQMIVMAAFKSRYRFFCCCARITWTGGGRDLRFPCHVHLLCLKLRCAFRRGDALQYQGFPVNAPKHSSSRNEIWSVNASFSDRCTLLTSAHG